MSKAAETLRDRLSDDAFARSAAEELVRAGKVDVDGKLIWLHDLEELGESKSLAKALAELQGEGEPALEQLRLAQLFGLLGKREQAAKSLRLALGAERPSLSLVVTMAEGAAAGRSRALAMGLIDWFARALMQRDDRLADRSRLDPVRSQPRHMGMLLERAAEVALAIGRPVRATTLLRTAASRYDRMGDSRAMFRCQGRAVRAFELARQQDLALDVAMRMRGTAQSFRSPTAEAEALGVVARLMAASEDPGDQERAISCEKEAVKLLTQGGRLGVALEHVRAQASLEARIAPALAVKTLLSGVTSAEKEGLEQEAHALRLAAARIELRRGELGQALQLAEVARKGLEGHAADEAVILLARILALSGAVKLARKALERFDPGLDDWREGGAALEARADLAVADGHVDAARALLLEAWRAWQRGGGAPQASACLLRRARLAALAGDYTAGADDLAQVRAGELAKEQELRAEVLSAVLADDPDEKEILLDEVSDRVADEGQLEDRLLVAVAKGEHYAKQGDPSLATEALESVVDELVQMRDGPPAPLRKGFASSPYCRPLRSLRLIDGLGDVVAPLEGAA